MDVATKSQIKDTVGNMIAQRALFSAYNISKSIQKMGFSGDPKEMRKEVHSLYRAGELSDYAQTMK